MPDFDRAQDLFDHIASSADIFGSASDYERTLESFRYHAKENNAFYCINPDRTQLGVGAKAFFKRCIRKGIDWYLRAIFYEQNLFNASVARSINDLEPIIVHLSTKIEKLEDMVEKLQANQEELSQRVTALGEPGTMLHKESEQ